MHVHQKDLNQHNMSVFQYYCKYQQITKERKNSKVLGQQGSILVKEDKQGQIFK